MAVVLNNQNFTEDEIREMAGLNRIEDFKNEWHEIVSIYRFIIKEENDDE